MDGSAVRTATEVYRWDGTKAKMTLSNTMLGTLALTSGHLLFLSTGGNDMGRRLRSAVIGGQVGGELAARRTGGLDLTALDNPGSFAVPLDQVDEVRAARRWDRTRFLALRLRDADGAAFGFAFMRKTGLPDAEAWAHDIEAGRHAVGP